MRLHAKVILAIHTTLQLIFTVVLNYIDPWTLASVIPVTIIFLFGFFIINLERRIKSEKDK